MLFPQQIECQLHLFRMIWIRSSIDIYRLSFITLLGIISARVGVWSYYYMDHEPSYNRFISLLFFFILSMILLILFSNLFMTLIGWDGLGITSFLLVIYYKNRKSLGSGMITGLTNRLGDCLLICALGFFIAQGPHFFVFILLLGLRITKRAQIPFSSWLPAAIAAPTPVSALVHSSTLVTAGVYVIIRYSLTDTEPLLIVGTITILMAGMSACIERDLKKVVALRTLSQLGVIIIAIGINEKSFCFFHLLSHACFKALLFLCIGTRIHATYGTQDYRTFKTGALGIVTLLGVVAIVSLMGFFYTTGFYRKDFVLENMYKAERCSWSLILFLLGVGFTSCYRMKIILSTTIMDSFRGTRANAQGGFSWSVKGPLFLLGGARVALGNASGRLCSPLSVSLTYWDKLLPVVFIITGTALGFRLSRVNSHILSSILLLTPTSQFNAHVPVVIEYQKNRDKGWIEASSLSLSSIVQTITYHYSPALRIGLRVLIILLNIF